MMTGTSHCTVKASKRFGIIKIALRTERREVWSDLSSQRELTSETGERREASSTLTSHLRK